MRSFSRLLLAGLMAAVWSVVSMAAVPMIPGEFKGEINVTPYMIFRVDPEGALTREQVEASPELFRPSDVPGANFSYMNGAVWGSVVIDTKGMPRGEYVLRFLDPTLSDVRVWVSYGKTAVTEFKAGGSTYVRDRAIAQRISAIPIEVTSDDPIRMLIRIQSYSPVDFAARLSTRAVFAEGQGWSSVILGLYYGMFITFLVLHLFLWVSSRDRSYLWFAMMLGVMGVCMPMADGLGDQFGLTQPWGGGGRFVNTGGALIFVASLLVTSMYFDMRRRMPVANMLVLGYAAALVVLAVAKFHPVYGVPMGNFALVFITMASFLEIGVGVVMIHRGYEPARAFVAAWVWWEIGSTVFGLSLFGVLPRNNWTCYAPHWGVVGLVVLWAVGIGRRLHLVVAERHAALINVDHFSRKMNEFKALVRLLGHDLSTPLTVILSKAKKGLAEARDDEARESWQTVWRAACMEREILDHVRRLESFGERSEIDDFETVVVRDAVNEVLFILEEKIQQKGVSVTCDIDHQQRLMVSSDPLILKHTLIANIVSNAIKHNDRGGRVRVSALDEGDVVRLRVEDNGPGLRRMDGSGRDTGGLGLTLVRTYIDKFGGRVEIKSRSREEYPDSHGTTVDLVLPKDPRTSVRQNPKIAKFPLGGVAG